MYELQQTDSPDPSPGFARLAEWNLPLRYDFSKEAVIAEPKSLAETVEVSTGPIAPEDEATRRRSINTALKRLRAIARRKPIGTVDEFIAARRAEAAKE